jgi:hypothetical protein
MSFLKNAIIDLRSATCDLRPTAAAPRLVERKGGLRRLPSVIGITQILHREIFWQMQSGFPVESLPDGFKLSQLVLYHLSIRELVPVLL